MSTSFEKLQGLLNPAEPTALAKATAGAQPKLKKCQNRSARLNLRLRPEDKKSIEETAATNGLSPGDYLVFIHREILKKLYDV